MLLIVLGSTYILIWDKPEKEEHQIFQVEEVREEIETVDSLLSETTEEVKSDALYEAASEAMTEELVVQTEEEELLEVSSEALQEEAFIEAMPESEAPLSEQKEIEKDIPAGIVVCIDPGHYKSSSILEGENMYGYGEGIFTLQVGLFLREELKKYGIESYMTRETDSITLGGYTDRDLDKGHIRLRGEYAVN